MPSFLRKDSSADKQDVFEDVRDLQDPTKFRLGKIDLPDQNPIRSANENYKYSGNPFDMVP